MTEDRRNLGSRLLAFLALWLMVSGLVLALSFVDLVLIANAILLVVGGTAAAVWGLRRIEFARKLAAGVLVSAHGARLLGARLQRLGLRRHAIRVGAAAWRVATAVGLLAGRAGRRAWQGLRAIGLRRRAARVGSQSWEVTSAAGTRARERAAGLPSRAQVLAERSVRAYALGVYRAQEWTARTIDARLAPSPSRPEVSAPTLDESLQARRLNALGTQLRRQGEHEQAAVQYRVALEIVRDLGDEHAEAMTLNNLALALAQAGAEEEAVEHLEHAREVLHELGDEEHEGQVIANLGIVYRRQGLSDEADTLLHEALDKLPPESPVYRQVERELVRAS